MPRASKNTTRQLDLIISEETERLSDEIRARYARDFRGFARDHLKVVNKLATSNEDALVPLEFNQCQAALDDLIRRIGDFNEERTRLMSQSRAKTIVSREPIEIVILKARKVGVSTYLEGRGFWKAEFNEHTNVLVMAHERGAARNVADIAQRFETFWEQPLDVPIRRAIARSSDDLLEWDPRHDSRFIVQTAGAQTSGGSSRSFSYRFVHLSEVAFFPAETAQVAPALRARLPFHETYLESTANGEGNMFHDEWTNALELERVLEYFRRGETPPRWWNRKIRFFWPWWAQDENRIPLLKSEADKIGETLDETEGSLRERFDLDLEQLAWRRAQIAGECSKQNALPPEDFFRQEDPSEPEEAFVSKTRCPFDVRKLNSLLNSTGQRPTPAFVGRLERKPELPEGFELVPGGRWDPEQPAVEGAQLVIWEMPRGDRAYVGGTDTAEGLQRGDWSVISIFDRTDGTQMVEVARLRGKIAPRELGEAANFLGRMFNEAFLVCERNAPGNSTVEQLVELEYPSLYHHRNIEAVGQDGDPESFTAGFKTSRTTKPMVVERAAEGLRDDEIVLRHPDAIKEWKRFTKEDGVYGAQEGYNDDTVIADVLAFFGMTEAPPIWSVKPSQAVVSEPVSGEAAQNVYWTRKLSALREKWAVWNERREALFTTKKRWLQNPLE